MQKDIHFVDHGLQFVIRTPHKVISHAVQMIWGYTGVPAFGTERILPDGGCVLLFNFGPPLCSFHRAFGEKKFQHIVFSGCQTGNVEMRYGDQPFLQQQIGLIFQPGGAAAFLKVPVGVLKNDALTDTTLMADGINQVYERMAAEQDMTSRLHILEQWVGHVLQQHEPTLMPGMLQMLRHNLNLTSAQIARKSGYSQQHLNRLFFRDVGLNVKSMQRVLLFQQVTKDLVQLGEDVTLTDIAYRYSFFDQAHFIHDFQKKSGMNPSAFAKMQLPVTSRVIYI